MSNVETKNCITLKGSAAILKEYLSKMIANKLHKTMSNNLPFNSLHFSCFLDYSVNSVLFQRGIYPAETFQSVQQYGLTLLMSKDDKIIEFLKNVLEKTEGN
jgi:mitotic spindle assembly checkpoint protein MAD2